MPGSFHTQAILHAIIHYCILFVWNAFDTQWVSAILIYVLLTKACQEKKLTQSLFEIL